ncbi:MAG: DUF523 domain-containing protein [Clostridiales bacterium]|nr:DUF523 domain-containing protein [Clostridiales bacterium]
MEKLLISACLLGICCRYDGTGGELPEIEELKKQYELIPVCPEIYGGLATPRDPAERQGNRVVTCKGEDVTDAYDKGAREALRLAELLECREALLKERSPSCGAGKIYDGSFTRTKIHGNGVTADLLIRNGIKVYGESQISYLFSQKTNRK